MSEKIQITVDGRPAEAERGAMLLQTLQELGVQVPTLCHHRSLEPSGACRLCVVEITHPDWGGWSGLVTSCLYPVEPRLQVSTRSARVQETRRTLLELYLARCPDSEVVRAVARGEGVETTPFVVTAGADLCIHCGLCTRVCQELGPAAIAALGRGTEKLIGPRPDLVGEDCTGCLACAHICPTGEIRTHHTDGQLTIWNRDFPIPLCTVQAALCRGCGVCEEVCPFAIPRVVVTRTGSFVATISEHTCVGCGICAGACPTGAIEQDEFTAAHLAGLSLADASLSGDLRVRTVAFACSRSPFPAETKDVITVPCIGRVAVEDMLLCLARGADGVLVMCRDQATCPYGPGGACGQERAAVAEELAAAAGLGDGRVRYVQPAPGLGGPAAALTDYATALTSSPLREVYAIPDDQVSGLDLAMALMKWFKSCPELVPTLPRSLAPVFADGGEDGEVLLYLGSLPELDLLLSLLVPDWRLRDVLRDGVELLKQKGLGFRPLLTAREIQAGGVRRLVVFGPEATLSGADDLEIVTLDELAGVSASDQHGDILTDANFNDDFMFQITSKERLELVSRLETAGTALRCDHPYQVAQIKLLTRRGAWLEAAYGEPFLAFTETVRGVAGEISS